MKKTFISMVACLAVGSAFAASQWHTNPKESNLLISADGELGASLPQVKETKDGKFWVTWLSWQNGMNGYIKAQLLDKDGNALLDEGGIYVMKQPTASWTSNYGMNVTPDGCLVVCHSDSRHDATDNPQEFTPFAYKMDQEGNHLWGLNGIEFPTLDRSGHRPKVGVTNDGNVIIGFNDMINSGSSDKVGFAMYKINEDGTMAWGNPLILDGGMFGAFEACDDDDLYVSIISGGALKLYRIDSLGDLVWEEPVVVEDRDPNTRSEVQPIVDELGGVVMPYQRYINLSVCYSGIQRITPDGETCMGLRGIDLSEELAQHSSPGISLNGKRQEIVAAWNVDIGSQNSLWVMKYDYSGVPLWDEPKKFGDTYMWGFSATQAKILDDGSIFICYNDKHGAVESDIKVMKLDADGNEIWTEQLCPVAYSSEPKLFFDEEKGEGYIFMCDNRACTVSNPYGGVYAQNFKLTHDDEVSVAAINTESVIKVTANAGVISVFTPETGVATLYSATGAKLADYNLNAGTTDFTPGVSGVYVVRVDSGSETKSFKVCI